MNKLPIYLDYEHDLLDIEDMKIIISRVGETSPVILCGGITEKEFTNKESAGLVNFKDHLK